ncbi:MAG: PAS domain S-box protein, partial [Armatimonadia bacterium]
EQLHRRGHALFEQVHLTRDGRCIPSEVNAHLIEFDERPAVLAIARDITERKETAARLAHLNSVLMAIRNVNQLITRVTDREELLPQACECLIETRGYRLACIATMDGQGEPTAVYTASDEGQWVSIDEDTAIRVYGLLRAQSGEPSPLALTPEQMQWTDHLSDEAAAGRTVMAIRLDYGDRHYGLLAISVQSEMAHDADEQGLFAEVAGDIAFALYAIETAAEREQALEQLELAQFSVARVSNGVFWTDETARIIYANDAALRKLGYTLDEICNLTLESIDPNTFLDSWDAHWEKLRANGSLNFETIHRTRDGREFPVEVSSNYLSFKGREYNFSFARDISIRKAAEERLRALNEQYELLVESQLVQTFIVQGDRLIFANQTMHNQLGYEAGELLGKHVFEVLAPEVREAVTDWYRRMQAGELDTNELETRVLTKQGAGRWVRIWLQEISDFGGSAVLIGHMVDITEERELRSQLEHSQRLESLGTLAGGVAHEFNNVLQAILLNASLLQVERPSSEREGEKLKTIIERTEYGARLTDQLLTFSRRAPVQIGPTDLSSVVEETRRLLERTMPRHVRLHCHLEPQLWTIHGDSGRIKQVLINLALNARDAMTGEGHVTFETQNVMLNHAALKTMQKLQPGPHVLLKVTDDGLGMDPQVASRAFEPFFTTKGVGQGTGLGLSIVHGIVDTHGGCVKLHSRPGQGTSFHIYFPAHPQSTAQATTRSTSVPQGGGNETILVVDDEPEVVRVAEEALTSYGYTVLSASAGEQALQIITDDPGKLDLVLLDLIMPGISGQETLARLRPIAPDLRVVFASGYMPDGDREEGPGAPNGYLDKPFTLERLLQTVRTVLDSR